MEIKNSRNIELKIIKVNAKDSTQKLGGAAFSLWKADESAEQTIPLTVVKGTKLADGITEADGTLSFSLPGDGIYYLYESTAPTGYVSLTEAVCVELKDGIVTLAHETDTTYVIASGVSGVTTADQSAEVVSWTFCINPTSHRPDNTGGYTLLEDIGYSEVLANIDS
ncbi:MAG: SpaA isopeptide-forming pilin-related protein, partial [Lachnospiraceae bacterium]|nr:SpaA isopeptide-forming pilin-related protein [Lachnospiraceae bacterium]